MKRLLSTAATGLAATLLLASAATAKRPIDPADVRIIDNERAPETTLVGGLRIDTDTGYVLDVYRSGARVSATEPEAMAREYLSEQADAFGLADPTLADLSLTHIRTSAVGHTIRLQQHVGDVPVYDAVIAVTFDTERRLRYVTSTYRRSAATVATDVSLSESEAWDVAASHLDLASSPAWSDVTPMVYASAGPAHMAYVVRIEPATAPHGSWDIVVDATDGTILKAVNKAANVDGTGTVFDPDPLSSATVAYGTPGYTDGNDATTAQLDAESFSRSLLDINFTGLQYELVGPWAEVQDFESPFKGLFPNATDDWAFNRFDDAFEAANTYYHIDTYMRYLNVTIGVNVAPYQYGTGVRFDPSGFSGADNSHYLSGSGRLAFGEGGVDDAEDADVVIHELGHGLHDWITVGGLSQVNGLSEGTGDFAAQSYSRSFGQWDPADAAYDWVFSWDGHNPFWGGRRTDWPNTYPGGLTGSIHTDGQIWSTCLMRIWDQIGREATDRAVWEGLAMTGSSTNQQGAANAVLQAADALGYSVNDIAVMVSEFQATGYNVSSPIAVGESASTTPGTARLLAARPNPFKSTFIGYELDAPSAVRLAVYDVRGRLVRALVEAPAQAAGPYAVRWDGTGADGRAVASGVYYFELEADGVVDRMRAVLIR